MVTIDSKEYSYTPLPYLKNGTYILAIEAQAIQGDYYVSSDSTYIYFAYAEAPKISFIEKNGMWISLGIAIIILLVIFIAFKYGKITINDFIYLKNKKIITFFKTIIFGPISINVNNKNIKKAEFFIDGKLKKTITSFPYLWEWRERSFLKHTLETRVYDMNGTSISSGEMTFYIFNPFH